MESTTERLKRIARKAVDKYGVDWSDVPPGLSKSEFRMLLRLISEEQVRWGLKPYVPVDDSKWLEYSTRGAVDGLDGEPYGDCFRWAAKFTEKHPEATVVHGFYKPRRRNAHAWVEWDGLAQDWQREVMDLPPLPIDEFRALKNVVVTDRYTSEEALVQSLRSGHWGPW